MIYLDTSVLVALLSNEATAPAIRQWFSQNESGLFATSDWSLCEFSSALSLKQRTGQLTARQVSLIHATFESFANGGLHFWEVSRQAFRRCPALIQSMPGLRAGDALHLAVAMECGAQEFATLDKLLSDKARQVNFRVTQF